MPRFSITQLLMGVALAAILIALSQSEGCGRRCTRIECVSFSPNGKHLLASRLDARDAKTPYRKDIADVSRTISLIDVSDGACKRILGQEFRQGNQGAAFFLWCPARTSASFLTDDLILVHDFGGGNIVVYSLGDDQLVRTLECLYHPANNIATSHNATLVAASGQSITSIVDVASDDLVATLHTREALFLRASLLAFSINSRWLAVGDVRQVRVWNLESTRQPHSSFVPSYEHVPEAITFLADDTLLVASGGLRQYDRAGHVVRSFGESATEYLACATSTDGNQIAASTAENVEVYDVSSGRKLHTLTGVYPTALAYAHGKPKLAIGDRSGTLTLVNMESGRTVWTTVAPGRYRFPWTVPGMTLVVWCYIGYRISRIDSNKATVADAPVGASAPRRPPEKARRK